MDPILISNKLVCYLSKQSVTNIMTNISRVLFILIIGSKQKKNTTQTVN
jgi:hypothetical protein